MICGASQTLLLPTSLLQHPFQHLPTLLFPILPLTTPLLIFIFIKGLGFIELEICWRVGGVLGGVRRGVACVGVSGEEECWEVPKGLLGGGGRRPPSLKL